MPIFTHDDLSLRALERGDLNALRELRNDSSTWSQLSDPLPVTVQGQERWFEGLSGRFYFVAYDKAHPFIGIIRLHDHDPMNRSIGVGADVIVALRRQGFGKKIYETLQAYVFDELNIHRMWLHVLETNGKAFDLYVKMGFKVDGKLREAVYRNGKYVDYIVMSILEDEYRKVVRDRLRKKEPWRKP